MLGLIGPPVSASFAGFATGLSLIVVIGAQNAFVLRQGLMRRHVFAVAFFCAGSDALLIAAGVGGISMIISEFANLYSAFLFGAAGLWLAFYGVLRMRDAIRADTSSINKNGLEMGLFPTLAIAAMLTFGNPHVYLDTVLLIGAVSLQFEATNKLYFGLGAAFASFAFFFSLGYGAKFLVPCMERPNAWRIVDACIAVIMFALAFSMLKAGGLI